MGIGIAIEDIRERWGERRLIGRMKIGSASWDVKRDPSVRDSPRSRRKMSA